MVGKRNPKIPKNDFEYDEGEICGFTDDAPIVGDCISSFSFDDDSIIKTNESNPIEIKKASSPTTDIFDNRRTPVANGAAPPIDGETPSIKRSYTLRSSTIRKINELKSIHPDINVCVSSIVDIAIDHYHNHIANEGGKQ